MSPAEIMDRMREFYESQWPDDEFPAEEAIELIAEILLEV